MGFIKYSEGSVGGVVEPRKEVSEEYLQKKLEKAANPDEDWIEKEASDDEDVPPWVKQ
ncbi:MAG TPA: hypothetical protein VMX17_13275 [Candidatus Glassbacteria bacterium]|nr:hypothetical protein [Candidatus Glassbacteria bacterium]